LRTLVLGDIHGCLTSLNTLLEMIQPKPSDLIVTLGDYVDRGPDSCGVLERLIDLHQQFNVVSLRGNHELMFQDAKEDPAAQEMWMLYGGRETLESFPNPSLNGVPEAHWHWLDITCVNFHESDSHIFVHAGVDPQLPLAQQTEKWLFWEKLSNRGPHISGKTVVCGHTAQKSGWPLNFGHTICIDTYVYGEGWLTCLEVETGRFWQSNEAAKTREGLLA